MQPALPSGCVRPAGPVRRLRTARVPELATSTLWLSRLTTTSSGEFSARAGTQPASPPRLMQPAGPESWVSVPSSLRVRTATALGKRLLATYTRRPSGLTATATGSWRARPPAQPPPGRWLIQPPAPASWRIAPVWRLRAKTASAPLADAAT